MCNVGMCCSLSTFLLFLIMTYDETAFRQDEQRRRKNEQLVECRRRKRAKKQEKIQDVKERMKSHLGVGPIGDELSNAAVENSMLLKMVILVCHNMSRGYENVHKGYMG